MRNFRKLWMVGVLLSVGLIAAGDVRADERADTVAVCHLAQSSQQYHLLNVPGKSIAGHLRHGDCLLDDAIECTIDACDPSFGCVHEADDSVCSMNELCVAPPSCDGVADCQPDVAPEVGTCGISPNLATLGQAVTVTLEASDQDGLSNIVSCTAYGVRVDPAPQRLIGFNVTDTDCDGIFTGNKATGGLFARGTWNFYFDCLDEQGNLATGAGFGGPGGGPTCSLVVE